LGDFVGGKITKEEEIELGDLEMELIWKSIIFKIEIN